jgi:hypothetical protein
MRETNNVVRDMKHSAGVRKKKDNYELKTTTGIYSFIQLVI